MNGKLVILSGPSGVGKDTVIDGWQARNPNVVRVVAYTTRAPRPGEANGVDYHFTDRSEFLGKAQAGDFLEYKEVHGNFYATPLTDMIQLLESGKIAVLKIDVQGALTVMEKRSDALSIMLLPPSAEELERRIRQRGTEDLATIDKRLRNALNEIAQADRYDHQVINEDLSATIDMIEFIVTRAK